MKNKMKIAVLSDTHGLLREQVKEMIGECEAVIHAGDINSQKILDQIAAAGRKNVPFYVVRGNNDKEWAKDIPETLEFELNHAKFFLVHNKKDIPEELGDIQIVIFGHSHKYSEEEKEGRLWLKDLASVVQKICAGMDKGQTVEQMAKKLGIDSGFVEEICRIRVTHPGVTVEGIVNKIEVNTVVGASLCKNK